MPGTLLYTWNSTQKNKTNFKHTNKKKAHCKNDAKTYLLILLTSHLSQPTIQLPSLIIIFYNKIANWTNKAFCIVN